MTAAAWSDDQLAMFERLDDQDRFVQDHFVPGYVGLAVDTQDIGEWDDLVEGACGA